MLSDRESIVAAKNLLAENTCNNCKFGYDFSESMCVITNRAQKKPTENTCECWKEKYKLGCTNCEFCRHHDHGFCNYLEDEISSKYSSCDKWMV